MTDDNILLDLPITGDVPEEAKGLKRLKWCEGHWAELMFALQDRNLTDQIAESPEELSEKLSNGHGDPCWDACNMINVGAIEIFGIDRIIEENDGCPVCAFANMVNYAADVVIGTYGARH